MAAGSRSDVVAVGVVAVYHCWSRCVRQAFLLGKDRLTGVNFDHRRGWLLAMQRQLARLFAIEIGFHTEMGNHMHLVLRTRPDIVETWSDKDVVRRWLTATKLAKSRDGQAAEPSAIRIAAEMAIPGRIKKLRKRLSHPSWFMGILCEYVARRCNREEGRRGVFWEDRYGCRRLLDEAAILVCGIYVDLNQIRAGEALTPETSTHTSAYDRIHARKQKESFLQLTSEQQDRADQEAPERASPLPLRDGWLCELTIDERCPVNSPAMFQSATGERASDKGLLSMTLDGYLQLLDTSGRMICEGKSGAIPADLAPILERLGIRTDMWSELITRYDEMFGKFVGARQQVVVAAEKAGRAWFRGISNCTAAFGSATS